MTNLHQDCDLTLAEIALRLGGCKKIPGGFLCKCPAHDDREPSLSLGENAKGALLVTCHAGCSQPAVIDALKSRGLWRSAGRKHGPARVAQARSPPAIVSRLCPLTPQTSHSTTLRVAIPRTFGPIAALTGPRGSMSIASISRAAKISFP